MPKLRISHFECQAHGPFAAPLEQHTFDADTGWWVAPCPQCDAPAPELPNMARLRTAKRTGPTSAAGRAKAARNLIGAPRTGPKTSEGKKKTAANAWKTGAHATTTPLPPAKPGAYPHCQACPYTENCYADVEDAAGTSRPVYCHQQTDTYLKFLSAYLTENPEHLRSIAAVNAARIQTTLDAIHMRIQADGILVQQPVYGVWEEVEEIIGTDGVRRPTALKRTKRVGELNVMHPLLNTQIKILAEIGFRLSDWQLTPKSSKETDDTTGHFDVVDEDRRDIVAHLAKRNQLLAAMQDQIAAANADLANDSLYQAHVNGDRDDKTDGP